jgi:tetratricopeptide (TPR) repeat protein
MRPDLSHYLAKFAIDAPIRSFHRWPQRTTIAWMVGLGLAVLAALVALLPATIGAHYRATGQAALADDAASAAGAFQQALRWSPNDPEIYRALAKSYLRLNQPQQAIDALEQAYRLRPASLLIQQELAQAYEAGGRTQQADALWSALGLAPHDMLVLGEQARRAKQYAEALAWYARAGRTAPDSGESLYYAGRAYRDAQQLDRSLQVLQEASEVAPDNRDVWYELGQTYAARNEGRRALEALRHGLDVRGGQAGRSNLYFWIGYVQQYSLSPRDLDGARVAYGKALTLDDYRIDSWQKAETHYHTGVLLAEQNRWTEAIPEYQRALADNPRHYRAHLSLALALWQVGHRAEAIAQAHQAVELDPNRKNAYRLLGDFYASERKVAEASAMYARVVELDPQDQQARKALEALR